MQLAHATILVVLLGGCSTAPYKQADLSTYAGRVGYLDKQVAPGRYIVEYSQVGVELRDIELNKQYWARRASELCPSGYDGEPEVIFAGDAKIEEFVCPQRFCVQYPLVSGVIQCRAPN